MTGLVSWNHAWDDITLDAALAELAEHQLRPVRTVLAESRDQPEVRSLRIEVLADRLVGAGRQLLGLAMDHVDPDLSLLAGAVAVREAQAIAGGAPMSTLDSGRTAMTRAYLRRAVGPLTQAAELAPTDPVPHDLLQRTSAERRDPAWEAAIGRSATHYSAHRTRLDLLADDAPERALAFARTTARAAGSGDPRVALVVRAHFRVHEHLYAAYRASGRTARGPQWNAQWDYFGNPAGPARLEIAEVGQRFLAAARPHPRALEAHNLFAAAFVKMNDHRLAHPHLSAIAGRADAAVWALAGGTEAYDKAIRKHAKGRDVPDGVHLRF